MTCRDGQLHERGRRSAWLAVLISALRELLPGVEVDEVRIGQLVMQLEETRRALRSCCEQFGDNDWGDNLILSDVVDKHLRNHLEDLARLVVDVRQVAHKLPQGTVKPELLAKLDRAVLDVR